VNRWSDPRLLALLGCGVGFASVYLRLSATLGLTLDQRGIPGTRVGLLVTLSALTVVVGHPLLRRGRLARVEPWRAMTTGYALLGAGLLDNGFAVRFYRFGVATALWSVGDLVLLGRAHGLVADIAPDHARARYFSVYGLCWGAAAVIAPFTGTQFLAHAGPGGLRAASALVCAVLAGAQPALRRLVHG
jgi:hypothetical protein